MSFTLLHILYTYIFNFSVFSFTKPGNSQKILYRIKFDVVLFFIQYTGKLSFDINHRKKILQGDCTP